MVSLLLLTGTISAQEITDTSLRIINFTGSFTQHVDSAAVYQFRINRNPEDYFWSLRGAPVGLTINKDNGQLTFKAAKNYFQSGKLKYDQPYRVGMTVQSLFNPQVKIDTSFDINFYNTEIVASRLKPTVSGTINVDEGDPISIRIQCETGTFPFDRILFLSTVPIEHYSNVEKCDDVFTWTPGFDFVKDNDPAAQRTFNISFIGSTRYQIRDTATIRVIVKNALNYPQALEAYALAQKNIRTYVLQLKFAFLQLDRKLKKVKNLRTTFDLTSAATALTGTVLNTSASESAQKTGKILPSVGIALVPIKEATAPNKNVEQNQASLIRGSIKRLEYMLTDNALIGDRDNDIVAKTTKLKNELLQVQVQLLDIPVDLNSNMTEEELNAYFDSPKVNKKYRLKRR